MRKRKIITELKKYADMIWGRKGASVNTFGMVFRRRFSDNWNFRRIKEQLHVVYRCPRCKRVNIMKTYEVESHQLLGFKKKYDIGWIDCTRCCGCQRDFASFMIGYHAQLERLERRGGIK